MACQVHRQIMYYINNHIITLKDTDETLKSYEDAISERKKAIYDLKQSKTDINNLFTQKSISESKKKKSLSEIEKKITALDKEIKEYEHLISEYYRITPKCYLYIPMKKIYQWVDIAEDGYTITTEGFETLEGEVPGTHYYQMSNNVYLLVHESLTKTPSGYRAQIVEARQNGTIKVHEDNHTLFEDGVYEGNGVIVKDSYKDMKWNEKKEEWVPAHTVTYISPKNALRLDNPDRFLVNGLIGTYANEVLHSNKKSIRVGTAEKVERKKKNGEKLTLADLGYQDTDLCIKDYGFTERCLAFIGNRVYASMKEFPKERKHRLPNYEDFETVTTDKRNNKLYKLIKDNGHYYLLQKKIGKDKEYFKFEITPDSRNKSRREHLPETLDTRVLDWACEKPCEKTIQRETIRGKEKFYLCITVDDPSVFTEKQDYVCENEYKPNPTIRKKIGKGLVGIDPSFLGAAAVSWTGECKLLCFERLSAEKVVPLLILAIKKEDLKMERSNYLMKLNPMFFNEEGKRIPRKGLKFVIDKKYKKMSRIIKEMNRKITAKKRIFLRELAYEALAMGDTFLIEDIKYDKEKQKKDIVGTLYNTEGECQSKHNHGRSVQLFSPGMFFNILTDLIKKNGGHYYYVSTKTACTSHNPFNDEVTEKDGSSVKVRLYIRNGILVQRDLFSANQLVHLRNLRRIKEKKGLTNESSTDKRDLFTGEHDDELLRETFSEFVRKMDIEMRYVRSMNTLISQYINDNVKEDMSRRDIRKVFRSDSYIWHTKEYFKK